MAVTECIRWERKSGRRGEVTVVDKYPLVEVPALYHPIKLIS